MEGALSAADAHGALFRDLEGARRTRLFADHDRRGRQAAFERDRHDAVGAEMPDGQRVQRPFGALVPHEDTVPVRGGVVAHEGVAGHVHGPAVGDGQPAEVAARTDAHRARDVPGRSRSIHDGEVVCRLAVGSGASANAHVVARDEAALEDLQLVARAAAAHVERRVVCERGILAGHGQDVVIRPVVEADQRVHVLAARRAHAHCRPVRHGHLVSAAVVAEVECHRAVPLGFRSGDEHGVVVRRSVKSDDRLAIRERPAIGHCQVGPAVGLAHVEGVAADRPAGDVQGARGVVADDQVAGDAPGCALAIDGHDSAGSRAVDRAFAAGQHGHAAAERERSGIDVGVPGDGQRLAALDACAAFHREALDGGVRIEDGMKLVGRAGGGEGDVVGAGGRRGCRRAGGVAGPVRLAPVHARLAKPVGGGGDAQGDCHLSVVLQSAEIPFVFCVQIRGDAEV